VYPPTPARLLPIHTCQTIGPCNFLKEKKNQTSCTAATCNVPERYLSESFSGALFSVLFFFFSPPRKRSLFELLTSLCMYVNVYVPKESSFCGWAKAEAGILAKERWCCERGKFPAAFHFLLPLPPAPRQNRNPILRPAAMAILFYGSTCPSRSRAINTACKRLSITATLRRYAPVRERELHQLCHGRRACRLSTVSVRLSLENSHHQARQDENRPCLSFHFMVR